MTGRPPPIDAAGSAVNRPVRSYKARQGRLSDLTLGAIDAHWATYGVGPAPRPGGTPSAGAALAIDPRRLFDGLPVVIEIGSGMGDAAVAMAQADLDRGVLAIEIHTRGVARTMAAAAERGLTNLKVACVDADALVRQLPGASLAGVRGYFPDPWPKARHRKRRLFDERFITVVAGALATGGTLHLATDISTYAAQMDHALTITVGLEPVAGDSFVIARPDWRPLTKYERTARAQGRDVTDLIARRVRLGARGTT